MIGVKNDCAELLEPSENILARKTICERKVFSIITRITAQLAELSLSFNSFRNTRTIYLSSGDMKLSFYYFNDFYVVSKIPFFLETIQIGRIIRTIVEDTEMPLFRSIPKIDLFD